MAVLGRAVVVHDLDSSPKRIGCGLIVPSNAQVVTIGTCAPPIRLERGAHHHMPAAASMCACTALVPPCVCSESCGDLGLWTQTQNTRGIYQCAAC